MKKAIAIILHLFFLHTCFAQETIIPAKNEAAASGNLAVAGKCAVAGIIKDLNNFPLEGIKVFVYQPDSSIIASGYTDADGYFETNSILPGTCSVKVIYPGQTVTIITGVTMKPGITPVNITAAIPTTDNLILYSDIAPKPVLKGKHK